MRRTLRTLALIGLALLLVGSACNRGNDNDDDDVEVTEAPSPTPSVRYAADFQLVGTIDEAFAGQAPDVELPTGDVPESTPEPTPLGSPGTSPATSPGASPSSAPVGANPPRGGIIRISLEAVNQELTDACGIEGSDLIEVFWTTGTFFEPEDVIDDIEDDIEDRVAGIAGRIYSEGAGDFGLATTSPQASGSPSASAAASPTAAAASPSGTPSTSVEDTDCILVAEQVGFTAPARPTPRPAVRRTAAPTAAPTAAATTAPPATTAPASTAPPATTAPATSPSATP